MMTKSEKMKLLVEIMTACRVHGYTQCQHDFQNPRTRERSDSFVVDIPSKEEVDTLYKKIASLYEKMKNSI